MTKYIKSGNCFMGECGAETGCEDVNGKPLFVGDIVYLFSVQKYLADGETFEEWVPHDLTAIVSNKYITYQDGMVELSGDDVPFVMGIQKCGFNDPEWKIKKVKSWEDTVDGERWPQYGFSYCTTELNISEAA